MEEKYFSTPQVAKILGVSRIAVFKQIQSGKIFAIKVGKNYMVNKRDLLKVSGKRLDKESRRAKKMQKTRITVKAKFVP
ncbi:MAG: hypothetical protein COU10_03420 [Candidatus Harrisonbacteria bacterium CG10_big_fil_rev_8_21_14_0_10_45_28]|uniref:Helix-turn-helix domain-containing protein n=1 Tax=Candidatus Harrisonbacteria bacterium CG10_big_fil_rev_8_21_14_0_10_45_28 TaxID=1974586 RepID=A0A2H0UMQ8_9BACT|nr:MAG: hypothetical protein COU10_03420 [Candidatus Harrisonbacteria bacterium CG10_big_fil_rev_8_21_14_0_10_45_28]